MQAPNAVPAGDHFSCTESSQPAAPLGVLVLDADGAMPSIAHDLLNRAADIRFVVQERESTRQTTGIGGHPDVVLLAIDARCAGAESVVRETSAKWLPAPVLVLTASEDRKCNRRLVLAGARGVVTHTRQADHLVTALHRVYDREIWLGRSCMTQLIDEMVGANRPVAVHLETADGLQQLTDREREVVALIAQGLHNKAIAAELGITDHTVRHHLTAIFAKLRVADRLELAVYAFRHAGGGAGKR